MVKGVDGRRPDTAVPSYSWYEYWYRGTTVLACDARVVPVDLAYVIFIDFLALGVLRFCFLLLSNVQFLVLVNLPPGRSHAGGISSRQSRRRYPLHLRARFSSRRRLARWRCPLAWLVSCGIPTDSCAASGPSCPRTPSRPSRWPSSWRATSTVHAARATRDDDGMHSIVIQLYIWNTSTITS